MELQLAQLLKIWNFSKFIPNVPRGSKNLCKRSNNNPNRNQFDKNLYRSEAAPFPCNVLLSTNNEWMNHSIKRQFRSYRLQLSTPRPRFKRKVEKRDFIFPRKRLSTWDMIVARISVSESLCIAGYYFLLW